MTGFSAARGVSLRAVGMGIGWMFNQTVAAEYGLANSDGARFVNDACQPQGSAPMRSWLNVNGRKCASAICNELNVGPLKNSVRVCSTAAA